MDDYELVKECKKALNIQEDTLSFDGVIVQKIRAVKSFMRRAGVSDESMNDDLAIGVIVMGVADLWGPESGEVKFSPAFNTLLSQLAMG